MLQRLVLLVLVLLPQYIIAAPAWQTVMPGLEYAQFSPSAASWGRLHVFRLDPYQYHLSLALASEQEQRSLSVKRLAQAHNALVAINGGFFSPDFKPLGLRVKNGELLNPVKRTSWWGIFYVARNRIRIVAQREYRQPKGLQFAIQGGPRLIVNGRIPKLKAGLAQRTAIGYDKRGRVLLVATQNHAMSTTTLARFLRDTPSIRCFQALNLDGGSSTQMYANISDLDLDIAGFSTVTDALLVKPGGMLKYRRYRHTR